VPVAYGKYGNGVEFFPDVEPDYGLLYVHARATCRWTRRTPRFAWSSSAFSAGRGLTSVYTRVGNVGGGGNDVAEDVVGVIQYEFVDWRERKPAGDILEDFRRELTGFPGVDIEVQVPEGGPPTGKAIQIQLSASRSGRIDRRGAPGGGATGADAGVIDISDGLPPPGVDWEIKVDRSVAARYGIGPSSVGTVVQLGDIGSQTHRLPPGRRR
jgi:multidrug efflux pump